MDGLSKTLKSFGLLPASISMRAFQPFSPLILLTEFFAYSISTQGGIGIGEDIREAREGNQMVLS